MGSRFDTGRISELPLSLANQIAAGEVVERPASVAKELLENSLDASARWIDVAIEQGGVRLVRVRDDGSGIHRDDLAVALRRHTTSKITSLADLEQVASLGFRGEALPSIASVSRLTLTSRCHGDDHGWRVTVDEQSATPIAVPVAHPLGTTVEVRDLFFSTPARRKFLRSERTEQRYLQQIVKRAALSRYDVGFRLQCDNVSTLRLPPAVNERARSQRLAKICGTAFVQHALQIKFEVAGLRLSGWVAGAGFSRATTDLQHFFVNGRWVRDSSAAHALRQAYQERVAHDRYPAYVLYIDIDPGAVDVNVHPTKHEIRFRERRLVHDFLAHSVASALVKASSEVACAMIPAQRSGANGVSPWRALDQHGPSATDFQSLPKLGRGEQQDRHCRASPGTGRASVADNGGRAPSLGYALGPLDAGRYLLAENALGLVLVDLRQALQRVIHRQLTLAFEAGGIRPRPLLIPVSLPVTPNEMRVVETSEALLTKLGLELRCVGPEIVAVRQIPSLVPGANPTDLVREVLSRLMVVGESELGMPSTGAVLRAMATRAAIDSELPQTLPEMNAVLREMEAVGLDAARNSSGRCWVQVSIDKIRQLFWQQRAPGERDNDDEGF